MAYAYPLMLDVVDRLIVIAGGGGVAARKARGVLDAGAQRVRAVAPHFGDAFPDAVERVIETYRPAHLDSAGLVFAATDSAEVNDAVVRDARARGLLVCRADANDDAPGDFATPAKFTRGPVTVTLSASGNAALAAHLRDQLAALWDDRWTAMAEAMQTLRPWLRDETGLDLTLRPEVFRDLASNEAIEMLAKSGLDGLRAWLVRRHAALKLTT